MVNNNLFQELIKKFPSIDVKVFRGGETVGECGFHLKIVLPSHILLCTLGVNPKINNMVPAYKCAKYPLILVSDSGIKSKFCLNINEPRSRL